MMNVKKLLTNQFAEKLLLVIIVLFRSKDWVYKFVPSNTNYKVGSIRIVKRKGLKYQLDLSDYQEWLVYFYCETDSSLEVIRYLNQSEVIIDIGANIGQTSLNMFKEQKKKGLNPRIQAFEPFPSTFEKLQKNIELNDDLAEISIHQIGIGAEEGELHMIKHCETNSGGFRITNQISNQTNDIRVPIITLDSFIHQKKMNQIDFIKIDIEGFEYEALKGMKSTLEQLRPTLFIEFSSVNMKELGIEPKELINFLSDLDYEIKDINGLVNFNSLETFTGHTDLLCSAKNK